MTMRDDTTRKAAMSSAFTEHPTATTSWHYQTRFRFSLHRDGSVETLSTILQHLSHMDLPGTDHVAAYLRYLTYRNRRPRTLTSRFGSIVLFLAMVRDSGKTRIEDVTRRDIECFIEHEQDRGNKITTIRTKLVNVQAFLRYLVEEEIVSPDVFPKFPRYCNEAGGVTPSLV